MDHTGVARIKQHDTRYLLRHFGKAFKPILLLGL